MKISVLQAKIKQAGISVRDLCAQADITTPTYYEMIKRNNTTAGHLEKLARILKFPVQELFDDDVQLIMHSAVASVSEPQAAYTRAAVKVHHVGRLIEERMKKLKMSVKEVADATGTSPQNISQMLTRQSIAFEKAVEINSILNPPGSPSWDLFSYYARTASKSIETRYIDLLEEYKTLQAKYLDVIENQKNKSNG